MAMSPIQERDEAEAECRNISAEIAEAEAAGNTFLASKLYSLLTRAQRLFARVDRAAARVA